MKIWMQRTRALASGSLTLSIGTAFSNIDFAQIFTEFIALILSALAALFVGGTPPTTT